MAVKLVLLHSPLLGPGTWRALEPRLQARGFEISVPDFSGAMAGSPPYYAGMVATARAVIDDASAATFLVAHSGAGALVPAIAAGGLARGAIFMDALLPHPGASWISTVSEPLKSHLVQMAQDGRVAPWHRWWPPGAIETLFSDPIAYAKFAAELNDLPIAYFDEPAPDAELPQDAVCAYLLLGTGYEMEAAHAENIGWPVTRLMLHHLAMLTHGEKVAAEIETLIHRLALRPAT